MPDLKKYKRIKLVGSELDTFLTTEMGIFRWFNGKKIKFNPKPFSEKKKLDEKGEKLVDFHVEIVKKIDALIEEREKETESEELDSTPQEKLERSPEEIVERREPSKRKPEIPRFKTEIQSENIFDDLDFEDELFEIEHPHRVHSDFRFVTNLEEPNDVIFIKNLEGEHIKDEDSLSRMLGGQDETAQKSFMGFPHIKFRAKSGKKKLKADGNKTVKKTSSSQKMEPKVDKKKTEKNNNFTKAKKKLENSKKLIEEKKKELEMVEKRAREKEEELKRKAREKKEKEKEKKKLEKLEAKRLKEEARRKERELKKREKAEELLKMMELKKAQKEAKIKERKARERAKMLEKKKKLEARVALKEEKLKKKKLEEKKKVETKKEVKPEKISKKKKVKPKKKKEEEKLKKTEKRHIIFGKKKSKEEKPVITEDEDLIKVLKIADNLLEKLSDDVIDEFVQSDDFELYEKVVSKYKIK